MAGEFFSTEEVTRMFDFTTEELETLRQRGLVRAYRRRDTWNYRRDEFGNPELLRAKAQRPYDEDE